MSEWYEREWHNCEACEGNGGYWDGDEWHVCEVCEGDEGYLAPVFDVPQKDIERLARDFQHLHEKVVSALKDMSDD